jgi:hypothetical protein
MTPTVEESTSGPTLILGLMPAWVLLTSGESMRIWFDGGVSPEGEFLAFSSLVRGMPNGIQSIWVSGSAIVEIEADVEDDPMFPIERPPLFRHASRSKWRLDEVEQ